VVVSDEMSFTPADRERLLTRLDRVCDRRASADDFAEIERLVRADREARWLYMTYIDLHGTLVWDAAAGLATTEPTTVVSMVATTSTKPRRRQTLRWLTAAAVLLIGLLVGRYVIPIEPNETLIVEQPAPSTPLDPSVALSPTLPDERHHKPVELTQQPLAPTEVIESTTVMATPGDERVVATPMIEPVPNNDSLPTGPVDDVSRIARKIDELLSAEWETLGITPSPRAEDAEWYRRLTLDVAGRIPTVAELEQFTSATRQRDETRARDEIRAGTPSRMAAVEALLSESDHVRHLTTVWSNLMIGRHPADDVDQAAFRKYLRMSFAENRPWNVIVAELLSAEGRTDENGATNYLVAHLNNQAVPATAITSRIFLGQQLHCAQCHNHPFNEVQQATFWELNSLFQQTAVIREPQPMGAAPRRGPAVAALVTQSEGGPIYYETTKGLMKVAFPRFNGQDVDPGPEVNRRQALANLLTTSNQPQLAAAFVNRMWAHFFGAGFTTPIAQPAMSSGSPRALAARVHRRGLQRPRSDPLDHCDRSVSADQRDECRESGRRPGDRDDAPLLAGLPQTDVRRAVVRFTPDRDAGSISSSG
jgi:hypothetical protein